MNTYRYLMHSRTGKYFQKDVMVHAESLQAADIAVCKVYAKDFVIDNCRHCEANTAGKYLEGIFA